MKAILVAAAILIGIAILDVYSSNQLMAEFRELRSRQSLAVNGIIQASDSQEPRHGLATDSELLTQALNSRFAQWGAVGVMLGLFSWMIMRHQPEQEKRRDRVLNGVLSRADELLRETRDSFLDSLRQRDTQYLSCLAEIRSSSEKTTQRAFDAKDKLAEAFSELARAVSGNRVA